MFLPVLETAAAADELTRSTEVTQHPTATTISILRVLSMMM